MPEPGKRGPGRPSRRRRQPGGARGGEGAQGAGGGTRMPRPARCLRTQRGFRAAAEGDDRRGYRRGDPGWGADRRPRAPHHPVPAPTLRAGGRRGGDRSGSRVRGWSDLAGRDELGGGGCRLGSRRVAGPPVRSGAPLRAGTKSLRRAATPEFGVAARFAASREPSSDLRPLPFRFIMRLRGKVSIKNSTPSFPRVPGEGTGARRRHDPRPGPFPKEGSAWLGCGQEIWPQRMKANLGLLFPEQRFLAGSGRRASVCQGWARTSPGLGRRTGRRVPPAEP